MRDCPKAEFRDLLPELLHDRLASDVATSVGAHVADCDDCAAELELLRAVRAATGAAPAVSIHRIVAALPAPPAARDAAAPSIRLAPRRRWGRWGAATGGLMAAGIGAVMLLSPELAAPPGGAAPGAVATSQSVPTGPSAPSDVAMRVIAPAASATPATGRDGRELALGADLADIGDAGLEALAAQLESLDALPALEPEETEVVGTSGGAR